MKKILSSPETVSNNEQRCVWDFSDLKLERNKLFLINLLAISPILFVVNTFEVGLILGAILALIYIGANKFAYLFKDIKSPNYKTAIYIFLVAATVTIINLLVLAFIPRLANLTGIYVVITATMFLTLMFNNIEEKSFKTTLLGSLKNAFNLIMYLIIFGFFREFLATGTIVIGGILPINQIDLLESLKLSQYSMAFFARPQGAFILAGLILGIFKALSKEDK